jgi:hypothetical protein
VRTPREVFASMADLRDSVGNRAAVGLRRALGVRGPKPRSTDEIGSGRVSE